MWVLLLPQCVAYLARTNVILPIVSHLWNNSRLELTLATHNQLNTIKSLHVVVCVLLLLFLPPIIFVPIAHVSQFICPRFVVFFLVVIVIRLWVVGQCVLVNSYDDNYLISCFTASTNCIDIWILSSMGGTLYINQYRLGSGNDAELRKACSYSWVVDTNSEGSLSTGVIVRDLNL